jgi:hypothetical protein
MGTDTLVEEYPDEKQRAAVCYTQWEQVHGAQDRETRRSAIANVLHGIRKVGLVFLKDYLSGMTPFSVGPSQTSTRTLRGLRHLAQTLTRTETLDGREYLVCSTVLMVEGVHNGFLYPADELGKYPESWNGRPVVVNHPTENGENVTASSPEQIQRRTIGMLLNTEWVEEIKGLRSEAWIDKEKCEKVMPSLLVRLEEHDHVEVSTGLFAEAEGAGGVWGNEKYVATLVNHVPDHFAILPNDKGACCWEDGAGIPRINKTAVVTEEKDEVKGILDVLKKMKEAVRGNGPVSNELSHNDIHNALSASLRSRASLGADGFLEVVDIFRDNAVYYLSTGNEAEGSLYKQAYTIDASDKVELVGDAVQVHIRTEYVPVTNQESGEADNQDGNTDTGKEGTAVDRAETIKVLIAKGDWGEADTEFLTNLGDEQFAKLAKPYLSANAEEEEETPPAAPPAPQASADGGEENEEEEETPPADPAAPRTMDELLQNVENADLREALDEAVRTHKGVKKTLIKNILANDRCPFTEDDLKGRSVAELKKLNAFAGGKKHYGATPPVTPRVNVDDDAPGPMPPLVPKTD